MNIILDNVVLDAPKITHTKTGTRITRRYVPSIKKIDNIAIEPVKTKRRVAAYARVSTDNEEQLTSYEAQVDYYTKLINANENYEFAGVFADEGVTGTSTKHRDGQSLH